jgi:predicted glycoside hydrolase/deacetylase ChbG (UPF0249 family)
MPYFFKENIILSADDFGASPEANANILKLVELKKLSRVAVLVDGAISPDETKTLLESGVKIDLHLNLQILDQEHKERKLQEGVFGRIFYFLFFYLTGKLGTQKVNSAWTEQLKKFQTLFGKNPDGLNSHQHIHFFPPYFRSASALCQKYNIPYLRLGKTSTLKYPNFICFILNIFRHKNIGELFEKNITTSDFLISLDWIKNLEKFLGKKPAGQTEIVFHPERKNEFEKIKTSF